MPAFATIIGAPCPPDRIDCNGELKARLPEIDREEVGSLFQLALGGLTAGSFLSSKGLGGRSCILARSQLTQKTGKLAQRHQASMKKDDRAQIECDKQY
jgi:hypothetical protein